MLETGSARNKYAILPIWESARQTVNATGTGARRITRASKSGTRRAAQLGRPAPEWQSSILTVSDSSCAGLTSQRELVLQGRHGLDNGSKRRGRTRQAGLLPD